LKHDRSTPESHVPLQDERSERAVVGACLAAPNLYWELQGKLHPKHFSVPELARIWVAMHDVGLEGRQISTDTVRMAYKGPPPRGVPLATFLIMLMGDAADSAGAHRDLADIIVQIAGRRALLAALEAAKAEVAAADFGTSVEQLQERILGRVTGAQNQGYDRNMKSLGEWAEDLANDIVQAYQQGEAGTVGFTSGLRAVDEVWGRLMPGKLYILAGMSGGGKSALARQLTESMAVQARDKGLGWGYVASLEMGGKEHALRTLSAELGFPSSSVEENSLADYEVERILARARELRSGFYPVNIDQTPRMKSTDVRNRMLRQKHQQGISFGVLDHILLIKASRDRDSLSDRVAEAVQEGKDLAKEFEMPMVMLSQIDEKKVNDRPSAMPIASDLFGSQMIKQMADAVGFIHRKEIILRSREPSEDDQTKHARWAAEMAKHRGMAIFFNDKRRGGQGGVSRTMKFDGPTVTFSDL
jgi:replicative DNA helicase